MRYWEMNRSLLEEQQVLLTAAPTPEQDPSSLLNIAEWLLVKNIKPALSNLTGAINKSY